MPKVSVIVPNYNHALYLQQRIDSILNQTYQDFELILLDDCSTDNSKEVLLQYQHHPKVSHLVFNEKNSGSTFTQWNKGMKLAQGEYIWIAESDDWAENSFVDTIVFEFENRLNVGLIYVASRLIDAAGEATFTNEQSKDAANAEYKGIEFITQKLVVSNAIWNASMMMFRKSIYPDNTKQKLYSNMKYCGDWFFYVLLSEQMDVLEMKQTLNYFRVHSQNVSTNAEKSGLTFIEGLNIYSRIKSKLSFNDWVHTSIKWAKNYNKYKYRYGFSASTRRKIMKILFTEQLDIFIFNIPIGLFYKLKK